MEKPTAVDVVLFILYKLLDVLKCMPTFTSVLAVKYIHNEDTGECYLCF